MTKKIKQKNTPNTCAFLSNSCVCYTRRSQSSSPKNW